MKSEEVKMAHNNGPHKRGMLRPGGAGSRIPFFIIIGLAILCVIMLYNVYTGTARKNDLQEEIDVLRVKHHMCSKDKLDSEKKYEMISKSMKQKSESDTQKIKLLQNSNSDLTEQLKSVNEQLTELKDSKKSADEQLTQLVESKQKIVDNLTETLQDLALVRQENAKLKLAAKSVKTENFDQSVKNVVRSGGIDIDSGANLKLNPAQSRENEDRDMKSNFETKSTTIDSDIMPKNKSVKLSSVADGAKNVLEKDTNVDAPKKGLNLKDADTNVDVDASNLTPDVVEAAPTKKMRKKNGGGRRSKTKNANDKENSPRVAAGHPGPPGDSSINGDGNEKNESQLDTTDIKTKISVQNTSVDVVGKHGLPPPAGPSDLDANDSSAPSSNIHLSKKEQLNSNENIPSPRGLLSPLPTQLPSESEKSKSVVNTAKIQHKNDAIADELLKPLTKSDENKDDDYDKNEGDGGENEKNRKYKEILPTPKAPNVSLKLKTNENKAKEDYAYRDNDEESPTAVGDSNKKRKDAVNLDDDKEKNGDF